MEPAKCFICNEKCKLKFSSEYLFANNTNIDTGRKLQDIVSEIIGKQVKDNGHSRVICRDCNRNCLDYDTCQARLLKIKRVMTEKFKKTLPNYNLNYDTYPDSASVETKSLLRNIVPRNNVPGNIKKPIVLPASKVGNIKAPPYMVLKNLPNLKVTQGSLVFTKSILSTVTTLATDTKTTSSPSLVDEIASLNESKEQLYLDSSILSVSTGSMLGFNSLPSNIFDNSKKIDIEIDKDVLAKSLEGINNESMEIDGLVDGRTDNSLTMANLKSEKINSEVFTLVKDSIQSGEDHLSIKTDDNENENEDDNQNYDEDDNDNYNLSYNENGKPITIGDLEIIDEAGLTHNKKQQHTILMEGEDGTLIQVTSGQKFIYGDNEISLIIPRDGADVGSDIENECGDENGDNYNQDSNDESQIELQMSGDEETAKAIMKANEEGGAYIAVQSGEFFKVKSVESKTADATGPENYFEKKGDSYICLICSNKKQTDSVPGGYCSPSAAALVAHLRAAHAARVYVCAACGEAFKRKGDYSRHIATHGQKSLTSSAILKKYECETCHKKFVSRNLLKEHFNVHSGERPYVCTVCGKSFASKYSFQTHQKIHLDRPRPFQCATCQKTFFTQQNLAQHEKTHSGVRDFKCSSCDKAFLTQHNLEVHSLVHSGVKPFVCGICDKSFARKPEIRDHMRTHTGERPFSCSICGLAFAQRSNLHSHVRAKHCAERPHACALCPQRFKRRRLLQYHVRARHTGERPLACALCGATFVYPEHWKKHVRAHSGERPYGCEVCGRTFASRDSRNAHRFVHSHKKPYECLVCGAGYMRRPRLYHHMNTTGHLTGSIVVNQPKISKDGDKETIELVQESSLSTQVLSPSGPGAAGAGERDDDTFELSDGNENGVLLPYQISEEQLVEISTSAALGDEQLPLDSLESADSSSAEGQLVRLVQVALPDGGRGWVAVS